MTASDLCWYFLVRFQSCYFSEQLRSIVSTKNVIELNFLLQFFLVHLTLREKCLYSEFFWSVFSRIWTECAEILRISPYSVQMHENTDQKNSEYGQFSRNVILLPKYIPKYNFMFSSAVVCTKHLLHTFIDNEVYYYKNQIQFTFSEHTEISVAQ